MGTIPPSQGGILSLDKSGNISVNSAPSSEKKKARRTQHQATYDLIRSGMLDHFDIAILTIIGSHANGSYKSMDEISFMTKLSVRKIKQVTARLYKTGLLCRQYWKYKRVHFWINTPESQKYWMEHLGTTDKTWPFPRET